VQVDIGDPSRLRVFVIRKWEDLPKLRGRNNHKKRLHPNGWGKGGFQVFWGVLLYYSKEMRKLCWKKEGARARCEARDALRPGRCTPRGGIPKTQGKVARQPGIRGREYTRETSRVRKGNMSFSLPLQKRCRKNSSRNRHNIS